ncbi:MAG: nicotinate-nucleotide adenylyltransferase [Aquimonas sp.]
MSPARPLHVIYGGTFDPVHRGHTGIARAARAALLDAGLSIQAFDFLPNADPPHRAAPGATAGHRVAMLWLALADESGVGIDLRELRRGGASYMVDTLAELRGELGPDTPLVLLLGEDAWRGFDRWQRWQEIPQLAHLLVVDRPHADIAAASPALEALMEARSRPLARLADSPAGGLCKLGLPPEPASATEVRVAVAQGDARAIEAYLEPTVAAYIARHGLYGQRASGTT